MSRIEESIEVNVPVHTAYNQWTQFEEFPRFMEGVERVEQLNDTTLRWTADVAGRTKSWEAKITTQEPDRCVAWQSVGGAPNDGTVTFQQAGGETTRINLHLEVEPEGPVESAGDALGFVQRRVKGDLKRFKEFIEARGRETGAWRGSVQGGQTTSGGSTGTGGSTGMGTGSTGSSSAGSMGTGGSDPLERRGSGGGGPGL